MGRSDHRHTHHGDYLASLGMNPAESVLVESVGVVVSEEFPMENDYPLLRKGCFYGSPEILLKLRWKFVRQSDQGRLATVIKGLEPQSFDDPAFRELHKQLLSACRHWRVRWIETDQRLLLNNKPFMRNLQGRICAILLKEHASGRTAPYTYRELIDHPDLKEWIDQNRPQIDVRLRRIRDLLDSAEIGCSLTWLGRGEVLFSGNGHSFEIAEGVAPVSAS